MKGYGAIRQKSLISSMWRRGRTRNPASTRVITMRHLLPQFAAELVRSGVGIFAGHRSGHRASSSPSDFNHSDCVCGGGRDDRRRIGQKPGVPRWKRNRVTTFDPRQATAQLEFLRAVNPRLERIAILSDLGVSDCLSTSNREAARDLCVEPQVIRVEAPAPEYEKAFASMEHERTQALIVLEEPINQACENRSPTWPLPTACINARCRRPNRLWDEPSRSGRQMARYTDHILRGANPGENLISASQAKSVAMTASREHQYGSIRPESAVIESR